MYMLICLCRVSVANSATSARASRTFFHHPRAFLRAWDPAASGPREFAIIMIVIVLILVVIILVVIRIVMLNMLPLVL